jgi:hypothetical protein
MSQNNRYLKLRLKIFMLYRVGQFMLILETGGGYPGEKHQLSYISKLTPSTHVHVLTRICYMNCLHSHVTTDTFPVM